MLIFAVPMILGNLLQQVYNIADTMVVGRVQHASVEEDYARGYGRRYGKDGFMLLVPAPQDLVTGQPGQSGIATLRVARLD